MDKTVVDAILQLQEYERPILATIIRTSGSTPRKAGAQILYFRDGRSVGTIGGGCSEAEVRNFAFRVLESGVPMIVKINMNHETAAENGMVCGGTMEVFLELV